MLKCVFVFFVSPKFASYLGHDSRLQVVVSPNGNDWITSLKRPASHYRSDICWKVKCIDGLVAHRLPQVIIHRALIFPLIFNHNQK